MPDVEVASLDPNYILWAAEKQGGVSDDAVAKAIHVLDRGEHWDYDDERMTIKMVVPLHDMYHEERYD